jgi:group I intron endonuclease
MKDKYSLYRIKCHVNGKLYFGITKRKVSKRISQHIQQANKGCDFLLHRAIRRHGWENFSVGIILSGLTMEQAAKEECEHIKKHKTCYENGYNMEIGGQTGISLRPETKKKKSEAAKAAWIKSEKWQASVLCPIRRKKIGENSKRCFSRTEYRKAFEDRHAEMEREERDPACRKRAVATFINNGNSTKVACIETGVVFNTTAEASRWVCRKAGEKETRDKNSNILACARGRKKTAYGYTWRLA